MALTQVVRLRLEAAGFNTLYDDHRQEWENLAEQAKLLIGGQVQGHDPTVDDIKKVLFPLIELNPHLRAFLQGGGHERQTMVQYSCPCRSTASSRSVVWTSRTADPGDCVAKHSER